MSNNLKKALFILAVTLVASIALAAKYKKPIPIIAPTASPILSPSSSPTPTLTPTLPPTLAPTIKPITVTSPVPTAQLSSITKMPGAGYHSGSVATDIGNFIMSCIGAVEGSFKMVTDSANDSDCANNCPVLSLGDFATRNNGFAAINGMYFCPADYATCSGKTNSFDTLFFNSHLHTYINSANNVYSTLPFFVMNSDGSPRFIGQTSEWGRDTGIQAGTAGNPMLVQGGNIAAVEGNLDEKQKNVKSNRGAIVQSGNVMYLCITQSSTVIDAAHIYKSAGADNAINIDGGGSSALWLNGSYIYGPGRSIPTAIIFAH